MNKRANLASVRGFTLLEVLCVIALVGMASAMVMLAIPDSRHQQDEYQKFTDRIQQTAQQAQLTGEVYGLRLLPGGWEIVVLQRHLSADSQAASMISGYHWQTASYGRKRLRHQLPAELQLTLFKADQRFDSGAQADPEAEPQLLFLPGGEVTAGRFYLSARADGSRAAARQSGRIDAWGEITSDNTRSADEPE